LQSGRHFGGNWDDFVEVGTRRFLELKYVLRDW
jgi:hypothetical protein